MKFAILKCSLFHCVGSLDSTQSVGCSSISRRCISSTKRKGLTRIGINIEEEWVLIVMNDISRCASAWLSTKVCLVGSLYKKLETNSKSKGTRVTFLLNQKSNFTHMTNSSRAISRPFAITEAVKEEKVMLRLSLLPQQYICHVSAIECNIRR
jgi:hypothetical protein